MIFRISSRCSSEKLPAFGPFPKSFPFHKLIVPQLARREQGGGAAAQTLNPTGVPRSYETSSSQHPAAGLGPCGGPVGGAVSYARGTPVNPGPWMQGERTSLPHPPGHLWRDKWTALSGPLSQGEKQDAKQSKLSEAARADVKQVS